MAKIYLEGLGLAGFRSFGDDIQRIGPLGEINVFVGRNNSGKSNILRFLRAHFQEVAKGVLGASHRQTFIPGDRHLESSGELRVSLGLRADGELWKGFLSNYDERIRQRCSGIIQGLLSNELMTRGTDIAWFDYSASWASVPSRWRMSEDLNVSALRGKIISDNRWYELWRYLCHPPGTQVQGGNIELWVPAVLQTLSPAHYNPEHVFFVPAIRHITEPDNVPPDEESVSYEKYLSGERLITHLAQLEGASYDKPELKARFNAINNFVQDVTGDSEARLTIPYDRNTIEVHMDGRTLPLENLGTGIEEVITLAAAATVAHDQMLCIEEPELHLHPILQRKLFEFLRNKTSCQIFVSTHSAHILDLPEISVFHVVLQDGRTLVEQVREERERANVCFDLGYRPSDLVQANSVLWVEGPSDRVHLNHWIHQKAPDLIEGIHYSIMWYGGSLLAHLTADDPAVDEFIGLRRLNHRMVVMMDSDRTKPRKQLGPTKKRIEKEFETGPGFAWVTKGRQIENYIRPDKLEAAVRRVHPSAVDVRNRDEYDDRWKYRKRKREAQYAVNRYRVACEVVKQPTDFELLDLKKRMQRLIRFIRESNEERLRVQ